MPRVRATFEVDLPEVEFEYDTEAMARDLAGLVQYELVGDFSPVTAHVEVL